MRVCVLSPRRPPHPAVDVPGKYDALEQCTRIRAWMCLSWLPSTRRPCPPLPLNNDIHTQPFLLSLQPYKNMAGPGLRIHMEDASHNPLLSSTMTYAHTLTPSPSSIPPLFSFPPTGRTPLFPQLWPTHTPSPFSFLQQDVVSGADIARWLVDARVCSTTQEAATTATALVEAGYLLPVVRGQFVWSMSYFLYRLTPLPSA